MSRVTFLAVKEPLSNEASAVNASAVTGVLRTLYNQLLLEVARRVTSRVHDIHHQNAAAVGVNRGLRRQIEAEQRKVAFLQAAQLPQPAATPSVAPYSFACLMCQHQRVARVGRRVCGAAGAVPRPAGGARAAARTDNGPGRGVTGRPSHHPTHASTATCARARRVHQAARQGESHCRFSACPRSAGAGRSTGGRRAAAAHVLRCVRAARAEGSRCHAQPERQQRQRRQHVILTPFLLAFVSVLVHPRER